MNDNLTYENRGGLLYSWMPIIKNKPVYFNYKRRGTTSNNLLRKCVTCEKTFELNAGARGRIPKYCQSCKKQLIRKWKNKSHLDWYHRKRLILFPQIANRICTICNEPIDNSITGIRKFHPKCSKIRQSQNQARWRKENNV